MRQCFDCHADIGCTLVCDRCWQKRVKRDGEESVLTRLTADVEAAYPGIQLRPKVKKQDGGRETATQRKLRERRHRWGKGTRLWTENA